MRFDGTSVRCAKVHCERSKVQCEGPKSVGRAARRGFRQAPAARRHRMHAMVSGLTRAFLLHCVLTTTVIVSVTGRMAAAPEPMFDQVRLIAPAAPGGGWDQTARVMQQVLQQSGLVRSAPVENIPGAAGTIGLARFVGSEQGRDDALLVSGLIMLGGIVMHGSPVTLREVTPVARLTGEYEAIVVPANSPFRTLADMIRALKERSEEHTSELQSQSNLVCRLLLEKK